MFPEHRRHLGREGGAVAGEGGVFARPKEGVGVGAPWRRYSRASHHLHRPVAGNAFHPLKEFPGRQPFISCGTPVRLCEAAPSLDSAWGRMQVSVHQGQDFHPHPTPTGLAQLSSVLQASADPHLSPPGAEVRK